MKTTVVPSLIIRAMGLTFARLLLGLGILISPVPHLHAQIAVDLTALIPGSSKVPPEKLQGPTLVDAERNFSIVAPGDTWVWLQLASKSSLGERAYVCVTPDGAQRLAITIPDARISKVTDEMATAHVDTLRRHYEEQGYKVQMRGPERTDVPLPESYGWSWSGTLPSGETSQSVGVLSSASYGYIFQGSQDGEAFRSFVRSFRLLRPPPPKGFLGIVHFVVVVASALLALLVNLLARRPILNGGTLGAVLSVCLVIYTVVAVVRATLGLPLPPGEMGRLVGRAVGTAVPALLLAVALSFWFRKRKAARSTGSISRR